MRLVRVLVLVAGAVGASGCNCSDRAIRASFPATVETAGGSSVMYGDTITEEVGAVFELIERTVSDAASSDRASDVHTLVWTVPGNDGSLLTFSLRMPIARGDVATVSLGSRGAGWGVLTGDGRLPPLSGTAYLERASLTPSTARGTLTVLEHAPLRLAVDVVFDAGTAGQTRLHGTLSFSIDEESRSCFT